MTTPFDLRGERLHAYDGHAADFARDCVAGVEAGAALAAADLDLLMELSCGLAASARAWCGLASRLRAAAQAPLDPRSASQIVLECLFEDALTPAAWRVLAAGVDIALDPPPRPAA